MPSATRPTGSDATIDPDFAKDVAAAVEAHREMILSVVKAKPDMTLVQIAEMLEAETGASFAPSAVWRFLDRHAITFKKNAARQRARAA